MESHNPLWSVMIIPSFNPTEDLRATPSFRREPRSI